MQTRLWKLARAIAFVVLQFGKRLDEGQLEIRAWQALRRVVDDTPAVEQRTGLGHYRAPLVLWIGLRYNIRAIERKLCSSSPWGTTRNNVTIVWPKTGSSSTDIMMRTSRPARSE